MHPGSAAAQAGAGLFVDEYAAPADVTIADSAIVGNAATTYSGGGLALFRHGVAGRTFKVTLNNTTVGTAASPNTTVRSGGGIYNEGGALTSTNSIVAGNTATLGSGGGLYVYNHAISGAAGATLTGSTVSGNTAAADGGGLFVYNPADSGTASATLTNSTVSGNTASSGGGLAVENNGSDGSASAALTNSTVSGNATDFHGGGLYVGNFAGNGSASAALRFATITGNVADRDNAGGGNGGGLARGGGTGEAITALSSIVAGNRTGSGVADDCGSGLTSQGRNLWGDHSACPHGVVAGPGDQDLAALNVPIAQVLNPALAANGGPTQTHTLVASAANPALDHGDNTACTMVAPNGTGGKDQRGYDRPQGAGCDIGAYEARVLLLATSVAGGGTGTIGPGAAYLEGLTVGVAATPTNGSTFAGWTVDGAAAGTTNPLSVTMNAAHTVVATFTAPPAPSPSPSPSPAPLTVPPPPPDQGTVTVQRSGDQATLTATPAQGQLFLGWIIVVVGASGQATPALNSWANPLTLTLTQGTTATAVFAAKPAFGDVPATDPAAKAIVQLAARGVINGCDATAVPLPLFCPSDSTLRHQMAALIVRAMPGWADETGLPSFSDNTSDTELMTRVATVQRHGVAQGYQDDVCRERGTAPPCYGPLDTVKYGQVMLFIARAMVAHNYWVFQPDDRTLFPDQNGAAGADPTTDRQTLDHRMVVTYVHYAGAPPDVSPVPGLAFTVNGVAAGGWGDPSSRAWFARALWQALTSYFGADTTAP